MPNKKGTLENRVQMHIESLYFHIPWKKMCSWVMVWPQWRASDDGMLYVFITHSQHHSPNTSAVS